MGYIKRLFGLEKRATIENPAQPMTGTMILDKAGGGVATPFGIITSDVALRYSTVWACVRLISETVGEVPLSLYQETEIGSVRAKTHPLYFLLREEPNSYMTSQVWREMMMVQLLLKGNSYNYIERNNAGRAVALLPLDNDDVTVGIRGNQKFYIWNKRRDTEIPDSDMLHIPGLSYNGLIGLSPLQYMANSTTLGIAAEEYGARYFSQGSTMSGVLETSAKLSDPVIKRLKESYDQYHSGLKNAHKLWILEEGLKFNGWTIPNEQAQFLQTRKFQAEEVARWYRVPAHKVGLLDRATNNNIEQLAIEFRTDTIQPWTSKIEAELKRKLLLPSEKIDYSFRFNLDYIERGDKAARCAYYASGRQWGWLSANDVRELENLADLDGEKGDIYLTPTNMADSETLTTAEDQTEEQNETPTQEAVEQTQKEDLQEQGEGQRNLDAIKKLATVTLTDAIGRMVRKEQKAKATAEFYQKHQETLGQAIQPTLIGLALALSDNARARTIATDYAYLVAKRYCDNRQEPIAETDISKLAETEIANLATILMGIK